MDIDNTIPFRASTRIRKISVRMGAALADTNTRSQCSVRESKLKEPSGGQGKQKLWKLRERHRGVFLSFFMRQILKYCRLMCLHTQELLLALQIHRLVVISALSVGILQTILVPNAVHDSVLVTAKRSIVIHGAKNLLLNIHSCPWFVNQERLLRSDHSPLFCQYHSFFPAKDLGVSLFKHESEM